ncbi:MAG: ABC transporter substrate-binding protein [Thermodesulfobacteriota bacterium]|nr:ABC transporter substrate-binding protein [Thermodesulfobacteriota bacterium]
MKNQVLKIVKTFFSLVAIEALCHLVAISALASNFCVVNKSRIIDQAGRSISVEKPFKRIISLYGAHTENLFALGLEKEIIGVSRNEAFPEKAKTKPVFSYHDDPEKFLAACPDLVLIRPMIDRGYPQLMARLEKSKIKVISLQPATVDEMFNYWKILGILTGKQNEASDMTRHFKKRVSFIKSRTRDLTFKKKAYFEAIHKRMKTFSPDSMAIFALETAGGINIAIDAKPIRKTNIAAYGKERILSHAAEIDVYLAQNGAMNCPTISLIKNETGFRLIKAVREDQVYIIDEMIVSRPTLRLLKGIQEIGKILYPEIFIEN